MIRVLAELGRGGARSVYEPRVGPQNGKIFIDSCYLGTFPDPLVADPLQRKM